MARASQVRARTRAWISPVTTASASIARPARKTIVSGVRAGDCAQSRAQQERDRAERERGRGEEPRRLEAGRVSLFERSSDQPRDIGAGRGHPACLVANLLATECPPAAGTLRVQPSRVDVAAADPIKQQILCEEQILGRGCVEAMGERHLAADHHPGPTQPNRDAEAIATARNRDALQSECRQ